MKRPGRESDYLPRYNPEVKNGHSYTSAPLCAFLWCTGINIYGPNLFFLHLVLRTCHTEKCSHTSKNKNTKLSLCTPEFVFVVILSVCFDIYQAVLLDGS